MQDFEHSLLPAAFSTVWQKNPVETNKQLVATIFVNGHLPLLSANSWTVKLSSMFKTGSICQTLAARVHHHGYATV